LLSPIVLDPQLTAGDQPGAVGAYDNKANEYPGTLLLSLHVVVDYGCCRLRL
jgi:hypothetical protein